MCSGTSSCGRATSPRGNSGKSAECSAMASDPTPMSRRTGRLRTADVPPLAIVWFRRDLRLHDHPALVTALREHDRVVPLFVLDPRLIGGGRPPPHPTQR